MIIKAMTGPDGALCGRWHHRRDLARPRGAQIVLQGRRRQIEMVLHRQDEVELLHARELHPSRYEQVFDCPALAGDRVFGIGGLVGIQHLVDGGVADRVGGGAPAAIREHHRQLAVRG